MPPKKRGVQSLPEKTLLQSKAGSSRPQPRPKAAEAAEAEKEVAEAEKEVAEAEKVASDGTGRRQALSVLNSPKCEIVLLDSLSGIESFISFDIGGGGGEGGKGGGGGEGGGGSGPEDDPNSGNVKNGDGESLSVFCGFPLHKLRSAIENVDGANKGGKDGRKKGTVLLLKCPVTQMYCYCFILSQGDR